MLKNSRRPNGTIKRTQYVKAFRGGVSSMGQPFKKGDPVLHLSSSRNTGETFVLLPAELKAVLRTKPGKWASPKKWGEQLHKEWEKKYVALHGHPVGKCGGGVHPPEFWNKETAKLIAK